MRVDSFYIHDMYFAKTPRLLKPVFSRLTWNIQTDEQEVYLTFDDGPTSELTDEILGILGDYGAKATFFCVGANVEKHPEKYQRIIDQGHRVANHTFNHISGWKVSTEAYVQNTQKAASYIDSKLFRPPYGRIKRNQSKALIELGYRIIMWDVLSGDFDSKTSAEQTVSNILKNVSKGSIVVMHDNTKFREKVLYGLPKILQGLKERGYQFKLL